MPAARFAAWIDEAAATEFEPVRATRRQRPRPALLRAGVVLADTTGRLLTWAFLWCCRQNKEPHTSASRSRMGTLEATLLGVPLLISGGALVYGLISVWPAVAAATAGQDSEGEEISFFGLSYTASSDTP